MANFLGIGNEAPPPTGPLRPDIKEIALGVARSRTFRIRVRLWGVITNREPMDWPDFECKLSESEFRQFASQWDAMRSIGWIKPIDDANPTGPWLFGIALHLIPFFGRSIIAHELFHAAQYCRAGITSDIGLRRTSMVEFSAHLWGSPLIGIPFVYAPLAATVWMIYLLVIRVLE